MKHYKGLIVVTAILFCNSLHAQSIGAFKTGDRVMFVGNSITNEGYYHAYIWLYYMTHFPNRRVEIYNKGIGGNDVGQMNERLDC